MPPEGYYQRRNQSLYDWYSKVLAIKSAINEQRINIFEHYIVSTMSFKLCNN